MDEIFNQLLERFSEGLKAKLLDVERVVVDEKKHYPLELNKKQCSEMLGIDTATFDIRFNSHKDFPRIPNKREKYPRDAVIEWYNNNWQRTANI